MFLWILLTPGRVLTTLHYLFNLRMGPLS